MKTETNQPDERKDRWWRLLVAGGIAGAVSRTCTAPLSLLVVNLQAYSGKSRVMSCFRYLWQQRGVWGMWKGNGLNLLKIAPEQAVRFAIYERVKEILSGNGEVTVIDRLMAGSVAGAFSQSATFPLEALRTAVATSHKRALEAARYLYRRDGVRSFYRGFWPNMLGIIPYSAIELATYESLKNSSWVRDEAGSESPPSTAVLLASGIASSMCAQLGTYPLVLLKTRVQAKVGGTTAMAETRKIMRRDGLRGFYRGLLVNILRVAPTVGITFAIYERCKQALGI